jgi:hypothetical protein
MNSLLYGLAAFSLWQTGLAGSSVIARNSVKPIADPEIGAGEQERTVNILEPILPRDMGLQRRDGPSVGLANDTSLFWGKAGNGINPLCLVISSHR